MKKPLALLMGIWLMPLWALAAQMQVLSFTEERDIDARSEPVRDNRGELCALVKVEIPLRTVVFEGSMVMRQDDRDGEYWVWLPRQAREFTIKHSHLSPLLYSFPQKLAAGTTYRLRIEVPEPIVLLDYQSSIGAKPVSLMWAAVQYSSDFGARRLWGFEFGQLFGPWGYRVDFRSNFHFPRAGAGLSADASGLVDGVRPFYDGSCQSSLLSADAALVFDCLQAKHQPSMLAVYAGAGSGRYKEWWGCYDGQWVEQSARSCESVGVCLGVLGAYRGFTCSLGVHSVGFKTLEMEFGLGYAWQIKRKVEPSVEKK